MAFQGNACSSTKYVVMPGIVEPVVLEGSSTNKLEL